MDANLPGMYFYGYSSLGYYAIAAQWIDYYLKSDKKLEKKNSQK